MTRKGLIDKAGKEISKGMKKGKNVSNLVQATNDAATDKPGGLLRLLSELSKSMFRD